MASIEHMQYIKVPVGKVHRKNGRTAVLFRHLNWKEVSECFRSCNYNWAMFLLSLKNYCETGAGTPYQLRVF